MSISASWIVLAVLVLRLLLKKAPKWVNVLLWGIVAIRLICPFSFESALSLIPSAETIPLNIGMDTTPTIDSGINAINNAVNPIISQSNTSMAGASVNPMQITIGIYEYFWNFGMIVLANRFIQRTVDSISGSESTDTGQCSVNDLLFYLIVLIYLVSLLCKEQAF